MSARIRRAVLSTAVGLLLTAGLVPVSAQGGGQRGGQTGAAAQGGGREGGGRGQQRRDAREDAPEGLIGTWIQNVAKSKYDPGPPLKSQMRMFDYTHDGMILCYYIQENQEGRKTIGHWAVTLDGRDWPEYFRNSGSHVGALVGIKKVDDYNMEITVRRNGRLIQNGMWTLAKDGQTLTQVLRSINAEGKVTATNTVLFEKQP
jgi:hypothetical protein